MASVFKVATVVKDDTKSRKITFTKKLSVTGPSLLISQKSTTRIKSPEPLYNFNWLSAFFAPAI